ncbi:MAG: LOG family protein, partial [Elusimicrobiota bacterium]
VSGNAVYAIFNVGEEEKFLAFGKRGDCWIPTNEELHRVSSSNETEAGAAAPFLSRVSSVFDSIRSNASSLLNQIRLPQLQLQWSPEAGFTNPLLLGGFAVFLLGLGAFATGFIPLTGLEAYGYEVFSPFAGLFFLGGLKKIDVKHAGEGLTESRDLKRKWYWDTAEEALKGLDLSRDERNNIREYIIELLFENPLPSYADVKKALEGKNIDSLVIKHIAESLVKQRIQVMQEERERVYKLLKAWPAAVSVFGSGRAESTEKGFSRKAHHLGVKLFNRGFIPRTGAGPAIMQWVLEGYIDERGEKASDKDNRTQGSRIRLAAQYGINDYVEVKNDFDITFTKFPNRKIVLHGNSYGTISFPGGLGTIDEIFEVLRRKKTLVLFGSEFYNPFLDKLTRMGILSKTEEKFKEKYEILATVEGAKVIVCDDINDAVDYIEDNISEDIEASKPDEYPIERAVNEIEKGVDRINRLNKATVFIGNPESKSSPQGEAKRLAELLTFKGRHIRVASREIVDDILKDLKPEQINNVQACLYNRGKEPELSENEKRIGEERRIRSTSSSVQQLLLSENSAAYVVLPGGVGVMNRLFDLVAQMQTGLISKKPVILIGSEYWKPFLDVIENITTNKNILKSNAPLISPGDMDIFTVVDTAREAELLLEYNRALETGELEEFLAEKRKEIEIRENCLSFNTLQELMEHIKFHGGLNYYELPLFLNSLRNVKENYNSYDGAARLARDLEFAFLLGFIDAKSLTNRSISVRNTHKLLKGLGAEDIGPSKASWTQNIMLNHVLEKMINKKGFSNFLQEYSGFEGQMRFYEEVFGHKVKDMHLGNLYRALPRDTKPESNWEPVELVYRDAEVLNHISLEKESGIMTVGNKRVNIKDYQDYSGFEKLMDFLQHEKIISSDKINVRDYLPALKWEVRDYMHWMFFGGESKFLSMEEIREKHFETMLTLLKDNPDIVEVKVERSEYDEIFYGNTLYDLIKVERTGSKIILTFTNELILEALRDRDAPEGFDSIEEFLVRFSQFVVEYGKFEKPSRQEDGFHEKLEDENSPHLELFNIEDLIRKHLDISHSRSLQKHSIADSVVRVSPKIFIQKGSKFYGKDGEKDVTELKEGDRGYAENRERYEKIHRALDILENKAKERTGSASAKEVLKRVQRIRSKETTIIALNMERHVIFPDYDKGIYRVMHSGRERDVLYFPVKFLESLDIENLQDMEDLGFLLNQGQKWIDTYTGLRKKKAPPYIIKRRLSQVADNIISEDESWLGNKDWLNERCKNLAEKDKELKKAELMPTMKFFESQADKLHERLSEITEGFTVAEKIKENRFIFVSAASLYSTVANYYEGLGMHEAAYKVFSKRINIIKKLQTAEKGLLPFQVQKTIVIDLLRESRYEEFLKELEILLTGKNFPRHIEIEEESVREYLVRASFITPSRKNLTEEVLHLLSSHETIAGKREAGMVRKYRAKARDLLDRLDRKEEGRPASLLSYGPLAFILLAGASVAENFRQVAGTFVFQLAPLVISGLAILGAGVLISKYLVENMHYFDSADYKAVFRRIRKAYENPREEAEGLLEKVFYKLQNSSFIPLFLGTIAVIMSIIFLPWLIGELISSAMAADLLPWTGILAYGGLKKINWETNPVSEKNITGFLKEYERALKEGRLNEFLLEKAAERQRTEDTLSFASSFNLSRHIKSQGGLNIEGLPDELASLKDIYKNYNSFYGSVLLARDLQFAYLLGFIHIEKLGSRNISSNSVAYGILKSLEADKVKNILLSWPDGILFKERLKQRMEQDKEGFINEYSGNEGKLRFYREVFGEELDRLHADNILTAIPRDIKNQLNWSGEELSAAKKMQAEGRTFKQIIPFEGLLVEEAGKGEIDRLRAFNLYDPISPETINELTESGWAVTACTGISHEGIVVGGAFKKVSAGMAEVFRTVCPLCYKRLSERYNLEFDEKRKKAAERQSSVMRGDEEPEPAWIITAKDGHEIIESGLGRDESGFSHIPLITVLAAGLIFSLFMFPFLTPDVFSSYIPAASEIIPLELGGLFALGSLK